MALPSAVTSRGDGNNFIATTGMVLTGITGFGIRTGFYLTNSGSHPIETSLGYNEGNTPGIFEFPSGQHFTILGLWSTAGRPFTQDHPLAALGPPPGRPPAISRPPSGYLLLTCSGNFSLLS